MPFEPFLIVLKPLPPLAASFPSYRRRKDCVNGRIYRNVRTIFLEVILALQLAHFCPFRFLGAEGFGEKQTKSLDFDAELGNIEVPPDMGKLPKPDEHTKLYQYGAVLTVGVIVLLLGIQQLNWEFGVVGAFFSAYGGFEVRLTYRKIENEGIVATQSGKKGVQINQTNPIGSPAIGRIDKAYFGTPPAAQQPIPEKEVDAPSMWWVNKTIAIDKFASFGTDLNEGDEIVGHVKSKDWISVQIMGESGLNSLRDDYNFNPYDDSGKVKQTEVNYTSPKTRYTYVVIVDEEDDAGETEGEAIVQLKINRKDSE